MHSFHDTFVFPPVHVKQVTKLKKKFESIDLKTSKHCDGQSLPSPTYQSLRRKAETMEMWEISPRLFLSQHFPPSSLSLQLTNSVTASCVIPKRKSFSHIAAVNPAQSSGLFTSIQQVCLRPDILHESG